MEQYREPIYPIEPWDVTETEYNPQNNYRNETTFALSNGYIGTRGTYEEAYDFPATEGLEGNFINGFYESEDIRYGEWNFGFPEKSQSLLNLPDVKAVRLYLDDEMLDMREGAVTEYSRALHMKEGTVTREFVWTSPKGRSVKVELERFVSFTDKNLMAMRYRVTALNFSGTIRFVSELNGNVENHTRVTNPLVDYGPFGRRLVPEALEAGDDGLFYQGHTLKSGLTMACGATHTLSQVVPLPEGHKLTGYPAENYSVFFKTGEYTADADYQIKIAEQETVCLEKFIVYTSDLDMAKDDLHEFVLCKLKSTQNEGYDSLSASHKNYVHDFWKNADVTVDGDDALQQGIRFNLFHIMQAAGRDGKTGMGAKGLTGEGYEGHYFWDTEMYVMPVLIYTAPDIAKKLLDYRFNTLDIARDRARVLGHQTGALYPWRTINGEEASTYFPLGTAQYHINADIAYAFWLYVTVTVDMEYLKDCAAEVLCETARVWADVGSFAECKGNRYCICAVTGPDEYNAIVDNNFYTNLMARENLRNALEALEFLKKYEPAACQQLIEKLGLTGDETVYWQRIIDNMYFPYDEKRQVYPLDDGFMMRKPWDDSKIAPEKRHLLYENFHPLFVYRQRMSKQADAILGMYLHSNLFTEEELKRNYDFYQEVTLHHSSLSTCIFGILACEIGYYEEAYTYFTQSARMDLDDYHNNFYAGIHAANMAGTWQAIVNGFAGLRTNAGYLELHPYLPSQWKGYTFKINYQGSRLEVSVKEDGTQITLEQGNAVSFKLNNTEYHLAKEGDIVHESKTI